MPNADYTLSIPSFGSSRNLLQPAALRRAGPLWIFTALVASAALGACSSDGAADDGSAGTGGNTAVAGAGGSSTGGSNSGGAANGGASGSEGALAYEPCSEASRIGGFTIELKSAMGQAEAYTQLNGSLRDSVDPRNIWEEIAEEGDCRLSVGPSNTCSPSCEVSQVCSKSGCVAQPKTKTAGAVTLSGFGADITLAPPSSGAYYTTLGSAFPPFEPGVAVTLGAAGGDIPAFTLRGQGIAPIEAPEADVAVETGKPVALTWTAPAKQNIAAKVHVELDIAHHGGIAARIDCDFPDTGSAMIPASLVTQLVARGTAGFPSVSLTRRTVDSATAGPGCVEFAIASQAVRAVTIPGVISCDKETPCPEARVCDEFTSTCK